MKKITITLPFKQIRSGNAPTASNLPDGAMAVGKVNGKDSIYINEAGSVRDIIPMATTSQAGLMSSADKAALGNALKVDGSNGTSGGVSALINKLGVGSSTPTDADYYVCQYAGGGTTTTTYHRRPMSALWAYIKSKCESLFAAISHTHTFASLTSKPTTLSGYGITDAASSSHTHNYLYTEQVSQEQNTDAYTWIREYVMTRKRGHVYNMSGQEWQYLYGIATGGKYGNIIRSTYGNGVPKMQLMGLYSGNWTNWINVLTESNYNSYSPSLTGSGASGTWGISISGNAATATKLATARNLWGNSFNGTGNISGDLKFSDDNQVSYTSHGMRIKSSEGFIGFSYILGSIDTGEKSFIGISLGWGANPEDDDKSVRINANIFTYKGNKIYHSGNFAAITIKANGTSLGTFDGSTAKEFNITYSNVGAAAASHTHSYLPLSGGTVTGAVKSSYASGSWINGVTNACLSGNYTSYGAVLNMPVKSGRVSLSSYPGGSSDLIYFGYASAANISNGTNSFTKQMTWDAVNNNLTADKFTGALAGNASTATALTSSAGNATQPVYFSGGKPVACTYTLGKSVPSDAVFTDTKYNFGGTTFYSGNSSTAEHNANNASSNGHYYYTSNGPATSIGASTSDGALYVQSYSSSWVAQIAQDYRNGGLYVRGKNNGTWQSWYTVLDSRNYTSYAAPATHTSQKAELGTLGHIKALRAFSVAATIPTLAEPTNTPSINSPTTTSGRYYGIEVDSNGVPFVNVPWTNTNTTTTTSSANKTGTKLFLVGATSQTSSGVTTYSNSNVYVGTDNKLYGNTLESYLTWDTRNSGKSLTADVTPVGVAICNELRANRFAYMSNAAIKVEYSTNGGSSWTDYGSGMGSKNQIFHTGVAMYIGAGDANTANTTSSQTRLTITAQDGTNLYVWCEIQKLLIFGNFPNKMSVTIEAKKGNSSTWDSLGTYSIGNPSANWESWNDIPLNMMFGGLSNQTSQYWALRFTFKITEVVYSSNKCYIQKIYAYGRTSFRHASYINGKGYLSKNDHLYSMDYAANATFPAQVTATAFNNSSDVRLKDNIAPIDDIDKVAGVPLVTFNYKTDEIKRYGVIAQDLEAAGLANLVTTPVDEEGNETYKTVDYISFLTLKIAQLEKRIAELEHQG